MKLSYHSAFIAGLIAAFILAQTPDAKARTLPSAQSPRQSQTPQAPQTPMTSTDSRTVKTIAIRLRKGQTPQQVADELKLLTPDEVALLAANPNMMSVGGHRGGGGFYVDETAVIVLVAVAIILVVVLIAVAVD